MTNRFTRKTDPRAKSPKDQKGFSLVELMITVAIIGIIASIAIPIYKNYVSAARHSKAKAMLMQLPVLMEQYRSESLTGALCPNTPCGTSDTYDEKPGPPVISEISAANYLSSFDPVLSDNDIDYEYSIDFDEDDNATIEVILKRSGLEIDRVTCSFPAGCDEDD
jgi:prepilin-type N-terminal cleavage/methylation domain-containing protein